MEIRIDPRLKGYLELREKALKERDAGALYHLAQIHARMKGKKNEKKAYELYKSSATHGYAKARFIMGLCNEKGIGVKQSLPMAITWYIRAEISAASDIADRSDTADEMDRERLHIFREEPGFATELDDAAYERPDILESVTIEEIAIAAEQGNPYAQNCLGHNYCLGTNGLEKDLEAAEYWHRMSAEQGCEAGIHNLAQFYKRAERYDAAVEWYRKYAELRIKQCEAYFGGS